MSGNLIVDFPERHECRLRLSSGGKELPRKNTPTLHRRVTFSYEVKRKFVEKLSEKYKEEVWYSRDEMESFTRGIISVLRTNASMGINMVDYAQMNVEDTGSFLGLEIYFPRARAKCAQRRASTWSKVLAEQELQRQAGKWHYDPERMSSIVEIESFQSFKRARILALLHASTR